jgi:hypothetical protein
MDEIAVDHHTLPEASDGGEVARARDLPCLSSATFVRKLWPAPVKPLENLGKLPGGEGSDQRTDLGAIPYVPPHAARAAEIEAAGFEAWLAGQEDGTTIGELTSRPLLDEQLRRDLLADERARWEARARDRFLLASTTSSEIARADVLRQYVYASQRVQSLGRDVAPKVKNCSRTIFPVACGCPSSRTWGAITCRQSWLCETCRKARARKIAGKVEAALDARVASEQARADAGAFGFGGWRSKIRIVLVTLTVVHSGDVRADRDRILRGWQNVRKRYHEEWGRFPSVLVWEVTPGTDGKGHVHAHVACVWPHRDWKKIRRWWISGTHDGRSEYQLKQRGIEPTSRINLSCGFRFKNQPRNTPKQEATPRSMARYLAKYISKGADSSDFSEQLTARVSACFYNQRSIVTSHRFWLPREVKCPCCGLAKTRARGLADEWLHHEPSYLPPEFDQTGPPDELLDALERGERRGVVWLS